MSRRADAALEAIDRGLAAIDGDQAIDAAFTRLDRAMSADANPTYVARRQDHADLRMRCHIAEVNRSRQMGIAARTAAERLRNLFDASNWTSAAEAEEALKAMRRAAAERMRQDSNRLPVQTRPPRDTFTPF